MAFPNFGPGPFNPFFQPSFLQSPFGAAPPCYGAPGQYMQPGVDVPKVFYGQDPTLNGVTTYKYRTTSGDVPCQGRTPGAMRQAAQSLQTPQLGMPPLPFQPTMPGSWPAFQPTPPPPMHCSQSNPLAPPAPPKPQGTYTVRYFQASELLKHHPPSKEGIVTLPPREYRSNTGFKFFEESQTVEDIIRGIGCVDRANYHYPYPDHGIGILELVPQGEGRFKVGQQIMLTTEGIVSFPMRDVFEERREIWVVRLPV